MNDWLERHRTLVLAGVGLLIAAGLLALTLRWETPEPITILPPEATATPGPIRVYLSGAVAQPDVYSLPPKSILQDAIELAGGLLPEADSARINLAQTLSDGQQVHIPLVGETLAIAPAGDAGEAAASAGPSFPININTASAADLEALPGIGPSLAGRIVDYRTANGPFSSIEAIQNVSGIGPATFAEIETLITVGP